MYQIHEERQPGQIALLIPAMLDDHFPLLRYAFFSPRYWPVILTNTEHIAETGLRYVHNDMCYPFHLIVGQMIEALRSGRYDPAETALLMPTVGDSCRGSNFAALLRKAVAAAGFPTVRVLTLNTKGIDRANAMHVGPGMVWRALFGLYYGDLLLLLTHQVRPFERDPGAAEALRAEWTVRLADELRTGRHLGLHAMKARFRAAARDFAQLPRRDGPQRSVALVGEYYSKYCALGNWDMVAFLEEEGWACRLAGMSWYVRYYIDNQIAAGGPLAPGWRAVDRLFRHLQEALIAALRENGFAVMDELGVLRRQVQERLGIQVRVADGWCIAAELLGHVGSGCDRVLAVQPFGCLAGHVCGQGIYAALVLLLPGVRLISVETDASTARSQVYGRVKLLLEGEKKGRPAQDGTAREEWKGS